MKVLRLLLAALVVAVFASACDNDFNPNAEWRETMVVYGLLDQDSDTTWIRVQKCFLGEGDMLQMSSILDSSNYPEGELSVKIVEWDAVEKTSGGLSLLEKTSETGTVFDFQYKLLTNKREGDFHAPSQPVYFCPTANLLDDSKIYELRVTNLKTGMTVTAETPLIGTLESNSISVNNGNLSIFTFTSTPPRALLRWPNVARARIYQPMIRFFYNNEGSDSLLHVDVLCPTKEATNELQMSSQINRSFFGNELSKLITDHDTPKIMGDSISLYLFVGDENLRMFRSISAPPTTLVQERGIYTNINGGLGIFAARRLHISRTMAVPPGSGDENYRMFIKNLNIGF